MPPQQHYDAQLNETFLKKMSNCAEEEEECFDVEKIIDRGESDNNVVLYRVRWLGYGEDDDTWEPIANLQHVLNLVKDFDEKYEGNLKQMEQRKRSGKKPKASYLNLGTAPPPPIKDDFFKKADEGRLELDSFTIYEKVKNRRSFEKPLNTALNVIHNSFDQNLSIDRFENSENLNKTFDSTEQISLWSTPTRPQKRKLIMSAEERSVNDIISKNAKIDHFVETIDELLEKCRNSSPIIARNSVLKKTNLSLTTDSVMNFSPSGDAMTSTPNSQRRRHRSEKIVRFADEHEIISEMDFMTRKPLLHENNVATELFPTFVTNIGNKLKNNETSNRESKNQRKSIFENWEEFVEREVLKEMKGSTVSRKETHCKSLIGFSKIEQQHPTVQPPEGAARLCYQSSDGAAAANVENCVHDSFPPLLQEVRFDVQPPGGAAIDDVMNDLSTPSPPVLVNERKFCSQPLDGATVEDSQLVNILPPEGAAIEDVIDTSSPPVVINEREFCSPPPGGAAVDVWKNSDGQNLTNSEDKICSAFSNAPSLCSQLNLVAEAGAIILNDQHITRPNSQDDNDTPMTHHSNGQQYLFSQQPENENAASVSNELHILTNSSSCDRNSRPTSLTEEISNSGFSVESLNNVNIDNSCNNNNNPKSNVSLSPDIMVDIDFLSGNPDLLNDTRMTDGSSVGSLSDDRNVQNVELSSVPEFKSSYRNIYSILRRRFTDSTISPEQVLKAYSQLLKNFAERIRNYVWPITYLPTAEETEIISSRLIRAIEERNFVEIEKLLSQYRPDDLNANSCYNDESVLVLCCSMKCSPDHDMCDIITFLIQCGVDPEAKSVVGETAFFTAAKKGHVCQSKILLHYNADIDALNLFNDSPLITAICECEEEKSEAIVQMLLRFGADFVVDGNKSCLAIACDNNKPKLVDIVHSHIENFRQLFLQHLDSVQDRSFRMMDTIIDMRCLKLKASVNWTFNFNITEVNLPKGYGACLFLALVEFDEFDTKFLTNCHHYVKNIQFNNSSLDSVFKNSKNIFWLQPLRCGRNDLTVQMSQLANSPKVRKLVVQANIVQILSAQTNGGNV